MASLTNIRMASLTSTIIEKLIKYLKVSLADTMVECSIIVKAVLCVLIVKANMCAVNNEIMFDVQTKLPCSL